MPNTLTSTVPGAIGVLETYFNTVAAANSSLNVGVYVGVAIANVQNNFLMIGDRNTGQLIQSYVQDWAGMPAIANRKNEEYEIICTIRTWNGDSDPVTRIDELFTLYNGVMGEFANDPNGSGALTQSGSWQVGALEIPFSGPLKGEGWGAIGQFLVPVRNVRLMN